MEGKRKTPMYILAVVIGIVLSRVWQRYYNIIPVEVKKVDGGLKLSELATIVSCEGTDVVTKVCKFRNLCYIPSENKFVFLVTKDSAFIGVGSEHSDKLLEMAGRPGSNHSIFRFETVYNTARLRKSFHNIHYSGDAVHILFRASPNDMISAFHDDLLPLYFTYRDLCHRNIEKCVKAMTLLFIDNHPYTFNSRFYNFFSAFEPRRKHHLRSDTMYCFKDATAGLSRQSYWIGGEDGEHLKSTLGLNEIPSSTLTGYELQQFANFTIKQLCLDNTYRFEHICQEDRCVENKDYPVVVLLRQDNRRVLNVPEMETALEKLYRFNFINSPEHPVRVMSLETDHLYTVICAIRNAKFLVGIHSDTLALSLFLPEGSTILELFPYGIDPTEYSEIKDLSEVQGRNVAYKAWSNEDPELSVLPEEILNNTAILDSDEDLRLHQDTIIDLTTFIPLVEEILVDLKSLNDTSNPIVLPIDVLPSSVSEMSCSRGNGDIMLSFTKPWNINNLGPGRQKYAVKVKFIGDNHTLEALFPERSGTVWDLIPELSVEVTVHAIVGGVRKGSVSTLICAGLPEEQAKKIKRKVLKSLKSKKPKPKNPFFASDDDDEEDEDNTGINREKMYDESVDQCSYAHLK